MKIVTLLIVLLFNSLPVYGFDRTELFTDDKFCGFVPRTASGEIKRNYMQLVYFKKMYPCPSTGESIGACPDWSIDHVIPLACGGCDTITNMQWLPNVTKSCSTEHCKDRYERSIQYGPDQMTGIEPSSCSPKLIKFNDSK